MAEQIDYVVWIKGASGHHTHTYVEKATSLIHAINLARAEHTDHCREEGTPLLAMRKDIDL